MLEVFKLAKLLLTMLTTNATRQLSFSTMKRIFKMNVRTGDRLNHCIMFHAHD